MESRKGFVVMTLGALLLLWGIYDCRSNAEAQEVPLLGGACTNDPPDTCEVRAGQPCDWSRHYWARVVNIVDGDTVDVRIYLGIGAWRDERLRFPGIDAWEVRGAEKPKGLLAKEFVEVWVESAGECAFILLETDQKRGKYGRLLADLVIDGNYLTQDLLEAGHAEKAPW